MASVDVKPQQSVSWLASVPVVIQSVVQSVALVFQSVTVVVQSVTVLLEWLSAGFQGLVHIQYRVCGH